MSEIFKDEEKENNKAPQHRAALPIKRSHHRFFLRQLQFSQQYAAMYRRRIETLHERTLRSIYMKSSSNNSNLINKISITPHAIRVLDLVPGQRAFSVGVVYKQMPLLPRFLDEYQKELVRIDAGEEDDDDDDEGTSAGYDALPSSGNELSNLKNNNNNNAEEDEINVNGNSDSKNQQQQQQQEISVCTGNDEIFIEDSSGRVLLEGVPVDLLCTGIILGVDATLRENGRLNVHSFAMPDLREIYVPRILTNISNIEPCYVAIVCGLGLGSSQMQEAEVSSTRNMIELLVDYLSGNLGDDAMMTQASRIARLVIAGNSIAPTDELKLKKKVKLEPSDHVRLGDERQASGVVTSAMLMKEFDTLLAKISDTIEVELMPGDQDLTNAFLPQQPLHPLLLPEAARRSSLKLVTNPYEFSVFPGQENINTEIITKKNSNVNEKKINSRTTFFISSGNNLNDVCRETRFPTRLDAMSMLLRCGCACPTAPNTLFSYPYKDSDPFIFPQAPHCFICCDQPEILTRWEPLESFNPTGEIKIIKENEEEIVDKSEDSVGIRLVCVPPFAQSGKLILINVNSPKLETIEVNFMPSSCIDS